MRAKTVNFERGQDPKQAMGLGRWGIKRALLSQPDVQVDTIDGDASRDWFENSGMPPEFKDAIDYNESDPLAFTDYLGFDEDYFLENDLPDWVEIDDFTDDFQSIGPRKSLPKTDGNGSLGWQEGKTKDGIKVFYYWDGLGSGYIAHKDWLK